MIQISVNPHSAALVEGRFPDPDETMGGQPGPESPPGSDLSKEASDGCLFGSPPPMPFPRVFPGL
jgi:hypothetical protein